MAVSPFPVHEREPVLRPAPADEAGAADPTSADRSRLGEILVRRGALALSDVDRVLAEQGRLGRRFGEAAVALRLVPLAMVDQALAEQSGFATLTGSASSVSHELVTAWRPKSAAAEDVRSLRAEILLRWQAGAHDPLRLTLASPGRGEGRSWLAANLAVAFAQRGSRTLLVDADLRHPRQDTTFALGRVPGLVQVLAGAELRRSLHEVPGIAGLTLLPAGGLPPNPQELLSGQAFDTLARELTQRFDVVLYDTPAADDCADLVFCARHSDAALLIAAAGRTRMQPLRDLARRVSTAGVRDSGIALNRGRR